MSAQPLAGKIALITGGSKGIGAAVTRRLVSDGAKVMVNYSSDGAPAEALLSELGADNVALIKADAGSVAGVEVVVNATVAKWGRIDILVPCAALGAMKSLADTTEADFDRVFGLNVKGPYFLCQKAVPHMPEGGRIVLFSTSVTILSGVMPQYLLYTATKGAIEQMTRVLAKDLGASKKIVVNAVAPGPTGTDLFYHGKPQSLLDTINGWHPQKRIGTPDEIAHVVAFAAGPGSAWVSGQTIYANGACMV